MFRTNVLTFCLLFMCVLGKSVYDGNLEDADVLLKETYVDIPANILGPVRHKITFPGVSLQLI